MKVEGCNNFSITETNALCGKIYEAITGIRINDGRKGGILQRFNVM